MQKKFPVKNYLFVRNFCIYFEKAPVEFGKYTIHSKTCLISNEKKNRFYKTKPADIVIYFQHIAREKLN